MRLFRALVIAFAVLPLPFYAAADEAAEPVTMGDFRERADDLYQARRDGLSLFADNKFDEAYPLLLEAARGGFKQPQARLGFMHINGLGGAKKDSRYALGWLGVAADGRTEPSIKKMFNDVWKRIPEEHQGSYQKVIDQFVDRYGMDATGMKCRRVNRQGSKIRVLNCTLTDPDGALLTDQWDEANRSQLGAYSFDGNLGGNGQGGGGPR
ncbi:MAG: hypothetical protein CMQ05_00430 [Gammaproteobacteria bacterium]|nr:hypothetical protein [Gammaproteobacteria bacterium]RPG27122.1 MAG: hypothetical protein CBC10_002150 [Gammaproteobacteria bacterium TMED50]|tara:strand:+ start:591 stop:1220 length:630 start_codon:yes stop_codon:yes gene_type:complete